MPGLRRLAQVLPLALALWASPFWASTAQAHFLETIPSQPVIDQRTGPQQTLSVTFTHPMEGGPVMDIGPLQSVTVWSHGAAQNLLPRTETLRLNGKTAYRLTFPLTDPGTYVFAVSPSAYWEAAEGKKIIHHSKVVVDAYGAEENWAQRVGSEVEILPLTRPYGLWTGAVFQGQVLHHGRPAAGVPVEVEYRGAGKIALPADVYATSTTTSDPNGVFTVALPRAGWWGLAALINRTETDPATHQTVPVEVGGLLWLYAADMLPR